MDADRTRIVRHIVQIDRWTSVFGGAREVRSLAAHDRVSQTLLTFAFADEDLDAIEAKPPEVEQEFVQLRDGHGVVKQLEVDVGE